MSKAVARYDVASHALESGGQCRVVERCQCRVSVTSVRGAVCPSGDDVHVVMAGSYEPQVAKTGCASFILFDLMTQKSKYVYPFGGKVRE
jgi:hypothetical protein